VARTDEQLTSAYERAANLGGFLDFLGKEGYQAQQAGKKQKKLGAKLDKRGIGTEGIETQTEFSASDASKFRGEIETKDGRKPRKSTLMTKAEQATQEGRVEESQKFYDEEVNPGFEQAQQMMDEILASPAFSPKFLADSRSNIMKQVKEAEESRLGRVSASLGLRGIAPGSPVAAALAQQTAEEMDQFAIDQLRQQGMQAEQIEQSSQLMEIQSQQQLAGSRIAARNAAIQGDRDRLSAINMELAGQFEALQQQRELMQMLSKMEREGGKTDYLSMGLGAAGGAVGAIFGGPMGASVGYQLGSGAGSMFQGNAQGAQSIMSGLGGFADAFSSTPGTQVPGMGVGGGTGTGKTPAMGTNFFSP
jgi:hypothetical protein